SLAPRTAARSQFRRLFSPSACGSSSCRPISRSTAPGAVVLPRSFFGARPPASKERLYSQAQVAPDELLHDLVRAGPDLGDPGVPPGAGHAVLVHVAVAAEELHAVVQHLALDLGAPPLRLGGVDGGE